MKFCIFGGFVFLGGCISLCAGALGLDILGSGYCIQLLVYLGEGALLLGLALGLYGLWKKGDSHRL